MCTTRLTVTKTDIVTGAQIRRAAAGFGYARGKPAHEHVLTHVHTAHGNTRASAAGRRVRVTVARRKCLKYEIPPGTRLTRPRSNGGSRVESRWDGQSRSRRSSAKKWEKLKNNKYYPAERGKA